jgi:hypothetical protein
MGGQQLAPGFQQGHGGFDDGGWRSVSMKKSPPKGCMGSTWRAACSIRANGVPASQALPRQALTADHVNMTRVNCSQSDRIRVV